MTETSTIPAVRGQSVGFELDVEKGVFHLISTRTGAPIATNLECGFQTTSGMIRSTTGRALWRPLSEDEGQGLDIQFGAEDDIRLGLQVRVHETTGGITLTLTYNNQNQTSTLREGIVLTTGDKGALDFCPDYSKLRFFRNGWQSWDSAGAVQAGARSTEQHDGTTLESSLVAGLTRGGENEGLILGFGDAARQFSHIRVDQKLERAGLSATVDVNSVELPPGETFASETLWVGFGTMPALRLLDYTRSKPQGRVASRLPVIWDFWYPGFEETSEKEILAALDTIHVRMPDVDTIMVADGYQLIHNSGPGIGDWLESNPRFPHGLAWLAAQIRKRGFRPGIWTAPFLIGESSQFYKYYASAVVRSRESDQPHWREMWRGDRAYYLDATHPDGRHLLRDIFETLCFRDGFEAFQVDFAYAGGADGFRFDRGATGAQALDAGLETIRKTIGENRYLLLSGAPVGCGTNYADAVRSTPDAGPGWHGRCGAFASIRNILTRSFHGDSFPAMAAAPILVGGDSLSDDEFRSLVTAVGLSGGPVSFSGELASISPIRQSLVTQ
ncbi:MAG: alpha-galactosidase, partial [Armatimonadota bacterium]|nr:alpha-galactosidase [Armatimonadota bacterium]